MPAGKLFSGGTLPVVALPARLMRSGEYSIRGTFDLIRKDSLCWFADALEDGSQLQVIGLMPEDREPAMGSLWLDARIDSG
jgi:hypothetical protein